MKHSRIAAALCLLLAVTAAAGCASTGAETTALITESEETVQTTVTEEVTEPETVTTEETPEDPGELVIWQPGDKRCNFTIVYDKKAENPPEAEALMFAAMIKNHTGAETKVSNTTSVSKKELVISSTRRAETAEMLASLEEGEYAVRVLPGDAEFAEKAKAESVEKLSGTIREALEKQAVEGEAIRRENEAVEMLMKKVDFAVPGSQVRRAMDGVLNEFAQRAQYSGLDADYFEKNRDKIMQDAEDAATKQVRAWYVFDAIAKAENIEAKDEEKAKKVIEFVLANAKK